MGWWEGNTHIEAQGRDWEIVEWKQGKGTTFKMKINKITNKKDL